MWRLPLTLRATGTRRAVSTTGAPAVNDAYCYSAPAPKCRNVNTQVYLATCILRYTTYICSIVALVSYVALRRSEFCETYAGIVSWCLSVCFLPNYIRFG